MVLFMTKLPFVDRTEKEVNEWFDNTIIVDAVSFSPSIRILKSFSYRKARCLM
jgi:hypothetical protein